MNINNALSDDNTFVTQVISSEKEFKKFFDVKVLVNIVADYIYIPGTWIDRKLVNAEITLFSWSSLKRINFNFEFYRDILEVLPMLSFLATDRYSLYNSRISYAASIKFIPTWEIAEYESGDREYRIFFNAKIGHFNESEKLPRYQKILENLGIKFEKISSEIILENNEIVESNANSAYFT